MVEDEEEDALLDSQKFEDKVSILINPNYFKKPFKKPKNKKVLRSEFTKTFDSPGFKKGSKLKEN